LALYLAVNIAADFEPLKLCKSGIILDFFKYTSTGMTGHMCVIPSTQCNSGFFIQEIPRHSLLCVKTTSNGL